MKKILSLCLILIIIVGLLSACQEAKNNTENNQQFSKIKVTQEPRSDYLDYFYGLIGKNHNSYQEALDDLVTTYNKQHDNQTLLYICITIKYNDYIEDSRNVRIEYYNEFFNRVWDNQDFKNETSDYQRTFARDLISCLYFEGMINESINFYDKYVANIKDKDELIAFTLSYSWSYYYDTDPDHDAMVTMLGKLKIIEKNYYSEVADYNKVAVLQMISKFAYKLDDTKTGDEYADKARDLVVTMQEQYVD